MKAVVDRGQVDPGAEERGALRGVDAAGEEVDVLRLGFEDVDDREAAEVAVLQVLELLAEHDRADLPVGVDEGEGRASARRRARS